MPRRNKVAVILIMPIAIFIWLIGWIMAYFGSKQGTFESRVLKQADLTFAVLPLEQVILPEM
jgi:hypothetical protein